MHQKVRDTPWNTWHAPDHEGMLQHNSGTAVVLQVCVTYLRGSAAAPVQRLLGM